MIPYGAVYLYYHPYRTAYPHIATCLDSDLIDLGNLISSWFTCLQMAVLYCSSKETKRKFVGEKAGAQLYEEELKDTAQGDLGYKVRPLHLLHRSHHNFIRL